MSSVTKSLFRKRKTTEATTKENNSNRGNKHKGKQKQTKIEIVQNVDYLGKVIIIKPENKRNISKQI